MPDPPGYGLHRLATRHYRPPDPSRTALGKLAERLSTGSVRLARMILIHAIQMTTVMSRKNSRD
jgi:hypothetical protein